MTDTDEATPREPCLNTEGVKVGRSRTFAHSGGAPPAPPCPRYPDGKFKDVPATFTLYSLRTGLYAHFSNTDLTPLGRPRVYQGTATRRFMY